MGTRNVFRRPEIYFSAVIIILLFLATFFYYDIVDFLFPGEKSVDKSAYLETVKFIVYLIGGLLLIWQIYLTNRRTKASEQTAEASMKVAQATIENIRILEKGQVQERFKNAIDQLGHSSEAINLGAVYTLHHIAKDCIDLRKSIFDILCSYIRQITTGKLYQEDANEAPGIIVQSILNLLFISKNEMSIYNLYQADLQNAYLKRASLVNAYLVGANLKNANLMGANLNGAILNKANFNNVDLSEAVMSDAIFREANLTESVLNHSDLNGTDFTGTLMNLSSLNCADLSNAILYDADLRDADLSGAKLNGMYVKGTDWVASIWYCTGETDIKSKYRVSKEAKNGEPVYRLREIKDSF